MIRRPKRLLEISTLLKISAVLTLIGLLLMVWSLAQPTPMPVILAMSVGQVLGILAFLLFGAAILIDQLRKQRAKGVQEVHGEAAPPEEIPSYPAPLHGASSAPDTKGASHEALP
jgi:hypothetical protein